jgi:hypothetical protein
LVPFCQMEGWLLKSILLGGGLTQLVLGWGIPQREGSEPPSPLWWWKGGAQGSFHCFGGPKPPFHESGFGRGEPPPFPRSVLAFRYLEWGEACPGPHMGRMLWIATCLERRSHLAAVRAARALSAREASAVLIASRRIHCWQKLKPLRWRPFIAVLQTLPRNARVLSEVSLRSRLHLGLCWPSLA